jgi:hypothetical protein
LFQAQFNIYSESVPLEFQLFAQKILTFVKPESLFTLLEKNDEKNCTAIFSAMYQQFQDTCQPSDSEILWLHQFQDIGCVGVKKLFDSTTRNVCYEPKVFFEFSLPSDAMKDKPSQLLSYINNSDIDLVHSSHWPVCLGIVVKLYAEAFTFALQGFYPVLDDDGKYKNARVSLFEGVWNAENISRLAYTILHFVSMDQSKFGLPMILDKSLYVGSVYFTKVDNINTVLKVFDGRFRLTPLKRDYKPSLQFIPNCKIFFQQDLLTIISYPFIDGAHYPANSRQILCLLSSLIEFHAQQYVVADIRASNIVFGKHDDGCFIDMDFCGKVGKVFYPVTFNLTIDDGKRHPEVQPGTQAKQEHDCFSLAETFKLFELKDDSSQSLWNSLLNDISNCNLHSALELLRSSSVFEFISVTEEELSAFNFQETGVSPQKK